ncbi:MAG: RecQ family ATP-dependent DNA helicase, partial [bacterium]
LTPALRLLNTRIEQCLEEEDFPAASSLWDALWDRALKSYHLPLRHRTFQNGVELARAQDNFQRLWEIGDTTCHFFLNQESGYYLQRTVKEFTRALIDFGYPDKAREWVQWACDAVDHLGDDDVLERLKEFRDSEISSKTGDERAEEEKVHSDDGTSGEADPRKLLKEYFGFDEFRPGQRESVESVLEGQHTLTILPTGGGKSLCYQLPAVYFEGLTLVISPLISLMQDQIEDLRKLGISSVALNSTLSSDRQDEVVENIKRDQYDLVYLAPERLRDRSFASIIGDLPVDLMVVDEAHCISQWGHDFRPDYLKIPTLWRHMGEPPIFATTATATSRVRKDIQKQLDVREQMTSIVGGFDRPNLSYWVKEFDSNNEKNGWIRTFFSNQPSSGDGSYILYVSTRDNAEEVAEFLREEVRISALPYHAGMSKSNRRRNQEQFIEDKVSVVCATNAFGMGIDKPDVRAVIHYNMPGTLEDYYQEAGRAGRDGDPAQCILLFSEDDIELRENMIQWDTPTLGQLESFRERLDEHAQKISRESDQDLYAVDRFEIRPHPYSNELDTRMGLHLLQEAGYIVDRGYKGKHQFFEYLNSKPSFDSVVESSREHRKYRESQLEKMVKYARGDHCRREVILDYFEDDTVSSASVCCDICESSASALKPLRETHHETLKLLEDGLSISEVAETRDYNEETVLTHVARLIGHGKLDVEIVAEYLSPSDIDEIKQVWDALDQPNEINPLKQRLP